MTAWSGPKKRCLGVPARGWRTPMIVSCLQVSIAGHALLRTFAEVYGKPSAA